MSSSPRFPGLRSALVTGGLLLALSSSSLFVAATWGDAPTPPPVRAEDVPEAVRDHLYLVDSVPVLRLQGTPHEMGYQHGVALKRQIHFLYAEYYKAMIERLVGETDLHRWAKETEPFIPEEYREEMRGLAKGSGLPYEEILAVNASIDRFQTVFCSTVVATGAATTDGETYFGRNLDFPGRNILQKMTVVLVWEPEEGTQLAAVTWPGLVGVLSGMNARGVAGATMMIHGGERRAGLPYLLMYRKALEGARSAEDVWESISAAKRTCSNNFMVVDAAGTAFVIEFNPATALRRSAERGSVCSTNLFLSDELRELCIPVGEGRYDTLAAFLERERGKVDLAAVQGALADVAEPWYLNVQAMVFLPARRSLHLAVGGKLPAARGSYVHLPAGLLFGADAAAATR